MKFPRGSGILLHPTSLPSQFGIGDLGRHAFAFVDFLETAKQTYWQILPLAPTGWGDSPYSSFSAFAGNTLLISPEKLVDDGLLEEGWGSSSDPPGDRVDYGGAYELKSEMLRTAFGRLENAAEDIRNAFDEFSKGSTLWLDDYALYRAIKASQGQKPWYEWDNELKQRDAGALASSQNELADEIVAEKFYQFLFYRQWAELKRYANEKKVRIVGDVPIFVALDSADVWRNQNLFKLNPDGSPKVVSGVPPDYFSSTGQLWGNPIYDWDAMRGEGFSWWIERIKFALTTVDILRIDHFLGFAAAWEVPGGDPTAEHGSWVEAPGRELFGAVAEAIGELPFWVEDLGVMTPEAEALRDDLELPGMRILQFAFGGDPRDQALPHNYVRNCIAYTGTHDNDTTAGWWDSQSEDGPVREYCRQYLSTDGAEINWDMIRAAWASVADISVAPLQDVFGLGNDARMNLPASTSGNWQWRFHEGDLSDDVANRLLELTRIYGRIP
jgi:4-alpha-glucanotransferase